MRIPTPASYKRKRGQSIWSSPKRKRGPADWRSMAQYQAGSPPRKRGQSSWSSPKPSGPKHKRGPADWRRYAQYQAGSPPAGSPPAGDPPRKPLQGVASQTGTRTNTVTSGAGSQREGKEYQVKQDPSGAFYHVYGRGAKARRVKLSAGVAKAYGYR